MMSFNIEGWGAYVLKREIEADQRESERMASVSYAKCGWQVPHGEGADGSSRH